MAASQCQPGGRLLPNLAARWQWERTTSSRSRGTGFVLTWPSSPAGLLLLPLVLLPRPVRSVSLVPREQWLPFLKCHMDVTGAALPV